MKRPVLVLVPTVALLLAFGAPFRHVNISSPDATILPKSTESRQGFDDTGRCIRARRDLADRGRLPVADNGLQSENVSAIHQFVSELASGPPGRAGRRIRRVRRTECPDEQAYRAGAKSSSVRPAAVSALGSSKSQTTRPRWCWFTPRHIPTASESKDLLAQDPRNIRSAET